MFHVELAPLGGILDPLKSDLGVFWAKIPLSSDWFYNVKTQKMQFLQNSQWEMAEIENIHCPICTQPIPSSWQNGLPPALATSVQRGAKSFSKYYWISLWLWLFMTQVVKYTMKVKVIKYFLQIFVIWNNGAGKKWGARYTFWYIFLLTLFNGDRRIVHWPQDQE